MAKCSKCSSPVCKCGPLHYSPLNQYGSLAEVIKRSNSVDTSAGASPGDINSGLFGAMRSAVDPNQPQTPTGTTGGLMQGVRAGNLMGGVNQATGTTSGLMQGASAGMTTGVGVQDDFQSTTEERLTALESGGQVQGAQTLESGATSDFIPQNQQEVVRSVVDGNKPSDRGIQRMMSKRNL